MLPSASIKYDVPAHSARLWSDEEKMIAEYFSVFFFTYLSMRKKYVDFTTFLIFICTFWYIFSKGGNNAWSVI